MESGRAAVIIIVSRPRCLGPQRSKIENHKRKRRLQPLLAMARHAGQRLEPSPTICRGAPLFCLVLVVSFGQYREMGGPSKRTKIVATIVPASDSEEMLRRLMGVGMDVARLNFSHRTSEQ